jgi:hypothetical protein
MGGLLKVSSPSAARQQSVAVATTPAVDTAQAERQRRLDALARQRAGRAGTIATSARGLLVTTEWAPQRKSLLGE